MANRQCLKFDGVNDYVDCGNDESLNITDAITIEAWVYPTVESAVDYHHIVSKRANWGVNTIPYDIYRNGTNFVFAIYKDTYKAASKSGLIAGEWYHIVGVYDGSNLIAYVNGEPGISKASDEGMPTNIYNVNIGRAPSHSVHFNGSIDSVRIYNRALSAEEVLASYRGLYVSRTGLVGEWLFEGNALDTSDESNNGTVYGAVYKDVPPRMVGVQSIQGISQITF